MKEVSALTAKNAEEVEQLRIKYLIQKQVVEQMKMIREQYGTTILIVTHNIGVIRAMADSMLVLKDGKMKEYGKTQEVLSHPQSDYTKRLLAAIPVLRR